MVGWGATWGPGEGGGKLAKIQVLTKVVEKNEKNYNAWFCGIIASQHDHFYQKFGQKMAKKKSYWLLK